MYLLHKIKNTVILELVMKISRIRIDIWTFIFSCVDPSFSLLQFPRSRTNRAISPNEKICNQYPTIQKVTMREMSRQAKESSR